MSALSKYFLCMLCFSSQKLRSLLQRNQSCQRFSLLNLGRSEYSHAHFAFCQEFIPNFYHPGPFSFISFYKSSFYFLLALGVINANSHVVMQILMWSYRI